MSDLIQQNFDGVLDGIPPENFATMVRSVHKYGRYGSLGIAV